MVKMFLTDESWYIVRNTRGVTGFVGPGSKPIPLSDTEVRAMGVEDVQIKLDVEVGENVIVTSGPLESFIGTKYNQDMSSCEYYFPKGYMEDNYERAAFALAIGEVSEVVETEEGFYVIQRLEPEEAYFETHMETLIEMYIVGKINLEFDAYAKMLSFEPNEYGKSLVLSELK